MPNTKLDALLLEAVETESGEFLDKETGIIYTIKGLLAAGANVNAKREDDGATAFMIAAAVGNMETLLAAGADVNAKSNEGATALMFAASGGQIENTELLIKNGANLEDEDNNLKTALISAVEEYRSEIVDLLMNSGANIHVKDEDGRTALMPAIDPECVTEPYRKISERLINAGVDVHAKDNFNKTTLMYAIDHESLEVAKLLIDKGVDVNAQDDEGMTALIQSTREGYYKIFNLLIDSGADVNVKDEEGLTALSHALRKNSYNCYQKFGIPLIRAGADINVVEEEGLFLMSGIEPKILNRMIHDYVVVQSKKGHDLLNLTQSTGLLNNQSIGEELYLETVLLVAMAPNTDPTGRNLIIENFNQREVQRYKDNACLIDPTNNNILGAGIETFHQLVELGSWNTKYLREIGNPSRISNWDTAKMHGDFILHIAHNLPARMHALEGQQKVQYLLGNMDGVGNAISGKSQSSEDEIKSTIIKETLNSLSQAERFRLKTTLKEQAVKRGIPEPEILNSVRTLDQYFERITITPAPNTQPESAQALSSNNLQRAI